MKSKKTNGSFSAKGYYIALILCAAAIGISGYLYSRNNTQTEQTLLLQEDPQVERDVMGTMGTEVMEAIATQPAATEGTTPAATQPASQATQPGKLKTGAPVSGETLSGYSMDCLSYNETTRDWRVHNGVDLAAEEGTQVLAAADGEVYTVYEDDTLGYTVVIRHNGGYTTRYSSLAQTILVKPGDTVTLGQPIGYVGSTALVETVLGPHVHFSVSYQDSPMDPGEFLALE